MLYAQLIVLVLVLSVGISQSQKEKLKVSIYYEALCPDSINFITRQLSPAYPVIGDYVDIDFVPYGKAHQKQQHGKWVFRCQHGPRECYGNQAQACALYQKVSQNVKVKFISCIMDSSAPWDNNAIKICAEKNDISFEKLSNCMAGTLGPDLLAKYGEQTLAVDPVITFIPTIIFNDVFNNELQDDAMHDFLFTTCSQLATKPKDCPSEIKNKKNYFWWMQ